MSKYRLKFSKTGVARYISHLDLMRTMQRAFVRSGLEIKHTQGFNPHPYMVFALPLSVGCESICELMDFELVNDIPTEKIMCVLNSMFPEGIFINEVYNSEQKFKDIAWLSVEGRYEFDNGVSEDKLELLRNFYLKENIIISRKTKRGMAEADIAPNINAISLRKSDGNTIELKATIAAQNPALNPEHLVNALKQLSPELAPDFSLFKRTEFFDKDLHIFK